jgi:hypothetical protein
MLRAQLKPSDDALDIWFGCHVTETKDWLKPAPPARRTSEARLKQRLEHGRQLAWHPAVRVAWFSVRQACHLFVDGRHHPLSERHTGFAELLGGSRHPDMDKLKRLLKDEQLRTLLMGWLDAGQLEWQA